MPNNGDKRFYVSWIDEGKALALARKRGATDDDGLWDYVEMYECEVSRAFPSRGLAFAFAKRNRRLDMYEMPRVEEATYQRLFDDLGNDSGYSDWERTASWEVDGEEVREIA